MSDATIPLAADVTPIQVQVKEPSVLPQVATQEAMLVERMN